MGIFPVLWASYGAELARDLHAVLERVRRGGEVVIEQDHKPVAVLGSVGSVDPQKRTISESIALAEERERQRGYAITLDPD
jgi:antitoxin (DNA-binding transcriptional repressor) of toxin-antitoxin stability system